MFECVLISHGSLADEFLKTINMIAGDVGYVKTFGLEPSQNIEQFQHEIQDYLKSVNKDVIVFSDLLGGSPMLAIPQILSELKNSIGLVTGMNLGMLIECLLLRNQISFKDAIELAAKTGVEGIKTIIREDLYASSTCTG